MTVAGYHIRLQRRTNLPGWKAALFSILAILFGLFLFSLIFWQAGQSPREIYKQIFGYAFFNSYGLRLTINRFIFLAFASYAFIIPYRAGLWNIGMPGQLYLGALAAFGVVYLLGGKTGEMTASQPVVITLMVLAALVAGALIGGIAGFLKGKWNVNEIVVTMMLNFIAFNLVAFMIKDGGPFMNLGGRGESFELPEAARAPLIAGFPYTLILVILLMIAIYLLFARMSLGYQIRAFGKNPPAARYAGVNPFWISVLVFLLGGALAGLAGYHYFAAVPGVYKIARTYGYFGDLSFYGMICGLISLGNPIATLFVALLFGGLSIGGRSAQGKLHLGFGVDYALMGMLMISLVAFQFFYHYQILITKQATPATARQYE
ncbi:MAG TPA: ABC transporter permease [Anaerolineae bacterium]|nr:ABC transporter permease [Anaerolineae bacterium]